VTDTTQPRRRFAKVVAMSSLVHGRVHPDVQAIEVRRAWRRYLRATREAEPAEYRLVEEQAWEDLIGDLAGLGAPLRGPRDAASR
jgi:hypothetical protein